MKKLTKRSKIIIAVAIVVIIILIIIIPIIIIEMKKSKPVTTVTTNVSKKHKVSSSEIPVLIKHKNIDDAVLYDDRAVFINQHENFAFLRPYNLKYEEENKGVISFGYTDNEIECAKKVIQDKRCKWYEWTIWETGHPLHHFCACRTLEHPPVDNKEDNKYRSYNGKIISKSDYENIIKQDEKILKKENLN